MSQKTYCYVIRTLYLLLLVLQVKVRPFILGLDQAHKLHLVTFTSTGSLATGSVV